MELQERALYQKAYLLSIFTVVYNIAEGLFSIYFGYEDETLSLLGFGIDSFIEVVSGLGIFIMIRRLLGSSDNENFETTALKITGTGFYILAAGLIAGGIFNIVQGHRPETTIWGIIISLVSIIVMIWLAWAKISTGKKLGSHAVISDGKCTRVCVYMSLVLLFSSLVYEITGFGWVDTIGAFGLAYFSYAEGKESFEKARGISCGCDCD